MCGLCGSKLSGSFFYTQLSTYASNLESYVDGILG